MTLTNTSSVHEGEHLVQAAALLANQVSNRAIEGHLACAGALNAHLVFKTRAHQVELALVERAIGVLQELGHEEERNALETGRRAIDASKNNVDNVVRKVVVTAADEDFGTRDLEGAIGNTLGASFHLKKLN